VTSRTVRWIGILTIVAGVILGFAGAGLAIKSSVGSVVDSVRTDLYTAPASTSRDFKHGTYLVMQLTSTQDAYGVTRASYPITITAGQVTVDGTASLRVFRSSASHFDQNSVTFTAFASFDVPQAGAYTVRVSGPEGAQFVIVRDLPTAFGRTSDYLHLSALGRLVLIIGMVLLIGAVSRGRPQPVRPALAAGNSPYLSSYPALPPPGWYFDPTRQAPRFWDGQRWQG
jgi:hypothetical protein